MSVIKKLIGETVSYIDMSIKTYFSWSSILLTINRNRKLQPLIFNRTSIADDAKYNHYYADNNQKLIRLKAT